MDSTDREDLAALDFSPADDTDYDDGAHADVFDFADSDSDSDSDDSAVDALAEYEPAQPDPSAPELDALADDDDPHEADPLDPYTSTVTNPAETVTVSALIDGSIRQIELSPKAAAMTETQLADEILVLAHLAQQKGLASQHTYLMENAFLSDGMRVLGLDGREVVRDMMENGMGLPTPQQADAEQAEVFASRYADDD
jgi:hypothetical protein